MTDLIKLRSSIVFLYYYGTTGIYHTLHYSLFKFTINEEHKEWAIENVNHVGGFLETWVEVSKNLTVRVNNEYEDYFILGLGN